MTGSKAQIATRDWHPLRHLRAVQFYGRAWHKFYRPRANVRDAPDFRHKSGPWVLPLARPKMMVGADDFRFLNESGRVVVRADWNSPDREKLWLYKDRKSVV